MNYPSPSPRPSPRPPALTLPLTVQAADHRVGQGPPRLCRPSVQRVVQAVEGQLPAGSPPQPDVQVLHRVHEAHTGATNDDMNGASGRMKHGAPLPLNLVCV